MLFHQRHRPVERRPLRRIGPAAEVVEGRLVGIDVAEARAALDRHVADGEALLHRHPLDRRARVLVGVADSALDAQHVDDPEGHVLGVDAPGEAGRRRGPGGSSASPSRGTASPGRHGPGSSRSRTRSPRPRHGWRCGCRRRRSSSRAGSGPARGRSRGRCPDGRCRGRRRRHRRPCVLRTRWTVISSASSSAKGRCWPSVGMMWSIVANVRSGIRTRRPASLSIW